ncbi:hypothetical protein IVB30_06605 [Bradyrhizobium sp. 200]|uniref:hypothetical protein n=1 Tax=Bradyrhizobium sp. 200 TaxID=2782665 RepID=UPI001FFFC485|nr:hypothetical protein [Bradyrhizobium sp. 200]UPJ51028.1 hypothetical protein IVB30_06605 [Bradyrhizobium sp. 200]
MPCWRPPPEKGTDARPRLRSVVTTVLLIVISIMIVRDILVRRWGDSTPLASDVVRPSR